MLEVGGSIDGEDLSTSFSNDQDDSAFASLGDDSGGSGDHSKAEDSEAPIDAGSTDTDVGTELDSHSHGDGEAGSGGTEVGNGTDANVGPSSEGSHEVTEVADFSVLDWEGADGSASEVSGDDMGSESDSSSISGDVGPETTAHETSLSVLDRGQLEEMLSELSAMLESIGTDHSDYHIVLDLLALGVAITAVISGGAMLMGVGAGVAGGVSAIGGMNATTLTGTGLFIGGFHGALGAGLNTYSHALHQTATESMHKATNFIGFDGLGAAFGSSLLGQSSDQVAKAAEMGSAVGGIFEPKTGITFVDAVGQFLSGYDLLKAANGAER